MHAAQIFAVAIAFAAAGFTTASLVDNIKAADHFSERDLYPAYICNDNDNLELVDMTNCVTDILKGGNTVYQVSNGGSHHLCDLGTSNEPRTKVSGRALDNVFASATAIEIGDAVQTVITYCGTRGGSAPAPYGGNYIVHAHNYWV